MKIHHLLITIRFPSLLYHLFIDFKRTGACSRLVSGSTAAPDHVQTARLRRTVGGGGWCLSAVSHPGWQMLFLQPAVSFLQTAPLSGHRLWPRNSNSLKCVKGSDPGAPACSFLPSINGEKRRSHKMLFSFFPTFEELHKLSGAVLFFCRILHNLA